jgi:hypothetical protein
MDLRVVVLGAGSGYVEFGEERVGWVALMLAVIRLR